MLQPPKVSIKTEGRIPRKAKEFSIIMPCVANATGVGMLSIGLSIENANGHPLPGTPLRINLRKECVQRGMRAINESDVPDIECNKSCLNNGWCNKDKQCQCPEGYMGEFLSVTHKERGSIIISFQVNFVKLLSVIPNVRMEEIARRLLFVPVQKDIRDGIAREGYVLKSV